MLDLLEEDDDWQAADIFLSVQGDGHQSEEDSADEELAIPSINNLSGVRLLAETSATVRVGAERHELAPDVFDTTDSDPATDGSTSSSVRTVNPSEVTTLSSPGYDSTATEGNRHSEAVEEPLQPKRLPISSGKTTVRQAKIQSTSDNSSVKFHRTDSSSKVNIPSNLGQTSERQKGYIRWQKGKDLPESQSRAIQWQPISRTYTNESPMPTEMFELLFDNSLATMIADETN